MDIADLFQSHYQQLVCLARKFVHSHSLAEDAVQDAFLSVIERAATFREGADPLPWLRRIVVNAARAIARSRRRHTSVEIGNVAEPACEQASAPEDVSKLLGLLPARQAQAIRLTYLDGLSVAGAARLAHVPAGTIKSRVHAGLSRLRARAA